MYTLTVCHDTTSTFEVFAADSMQFALCNPFCMNLAACSRVRYFPLCVCMGFHRQTWPNLNHHPAFHIHHHSVYMTILISHVCLCANRWWKKRKKNSKKGKGYKDRRGGGGGGDVWPYLKDPASIYNGWSLSLALNKPDQEDSLTARHTLRGRKKKTFHHTCILSNTRTDGFSLWK